MILRLCFIWSIVAFTNAIQLFAVPKFQLGFEIPGLGFADPSAFEMAENVKEGMDSLLNQAALKRPGVKTKVKDEKKGNMKIHTVEQNGKGFHSFSRLMTFDNSNNGTNGTENLTPGKFGPGQFGPGKFGPFGPFGGFGNEFLENDFDEEEDDTKKKGKRCSGSKPCKDSEYCDPLDNLCKPRLDEGETCTIKKQCKKDGGIICIWGKCSEGKSGDPGSFCKKSDDCSGDACCNLHSDISHTYPICTPKLGEGATCGQSNPLSALTDFFGVKKLDNDEVKSKKCNPCKDGLKCAAIGMFGRKVCVPEDLKEKPNNRKSEERKGDNEVEEEESEEDDNEGSAKTSADKPENAEEENESLKQQPFPVKNPKPVPPQAPPKPKPNSQSQSSEDKEEEPKPSPPNQPPPSNPENQQKPNSSPNEGPNPITPQQPSNAGGKPPVPQVASPNEKKPGQKKPKGSHKKKKNRKSD